MDLELRGRVALVTGGAGGVGGAVVRALVGEGCRVAVVDRRCHAAAFADLDRDAILLLDSDVRDFQHAAAVVGRAVGHFQRLDILVCCAGITADGMSWKLSEAAWDDVIDVNLKGCFNYAHAAVPALRAAGGGRIVNIASINGMRGKAGQANYAAAKAGMIGLSKTLARELGRFGITVNVVAPGMTLTPMTRDLGDDALRRALDETVLGRLCDPDDIADAVLFLCSGRARQITGDVLRVDAGQYI